MGAKRTRISHCTPISPIPPPARFSLPSTALLQTGAERGATGGPRGVPGGGRAPALPAPAAASPKVPPVAQGQSGRAADCRGGGPEWRTAAWAIPNPTTRPSSRTSRAPPVCPPELSLNPAWDSGSPVTCGRAGRGRAAERCGAGSPPPPLRRGRAPGRAPAGRAGRCPPRSPRQCQRGLGLCGHLPRSPLPAAGGRGIFSIASLYSSPKVSPTYLFICRRAPRCRRAARAAPRRAERWKRLGIAAGRAER